MKICNMHTMTYSAKTNHKQSLTEKTGLTKIPKENRVEAIKAEQKKDFKDMKQALGIGALIMVVSFLTGITKKKPIKPLILSSIELGAALSFPIYFCKMMITKSKDKNLH